MSNTKKIKLNVTDRPMGYAVSLAAKLERTDTLKLGIGLLAVGSLSILLSTKAGEKYLIGFINNAYNIFRTKYDLSEDNFIYVTGRYIEVID